MTTLSQPTIKCPEKKIGKKKKKGKRKGSVARSQEFKSVSFRENKIIPKQTSVRNLYFRHVAPRINAMALI
jgi:hypothetical protein